MPRPSTKPIQTHPASPIYAPEPDVPWGTGGIDDWGWQAVAAPQFSTSSPTKPISPASRKELISYV